MMAKQSKEEKTKRATTKRAPKANRPSSQRHLRNAKNASLSAQRSTRSRATTLHEGGCSQRAVRRTEAETTAQSWFNDRGNQWAVSR